MPPDATDPTATAGTGDLACDLLVVGSGAGGLSTAVVAASLGLDVIVVEKDRQVGGTTAWSGGWLWIPRNPLAQAAGILEDIEAPRRYLRHELGDFYDDALVTMFLEQGPRMVAHFVCETSVAFIDGNAVPDFHGDAPGAATGGRSVCAAPYDGRQLGRRMALLRAPLDEMAPFGMGIASGADLRHFLNATRTLASFRHVSRRLMRHGRDMVRHRRGMYLVGGNALVARLLRSADDLGVRIITGAPASELRMDGGRVVGATVRIASRDVPIRTTRGVVLASGGFPHDPARRRALFAGKAGGEHFSAAPTTNQGDGLRLGEAAGGDVRADLAHAGAWAPVSLVPRGGGAVGRLPHLLERAKPGVIMVRRDGRRFCNEAASYHDVMTALMAATPDGEPVRAWLVCDDAFIRRYGLGRVRPRPFPIGPWVRRGYLRRGSTPGDLARACGIDEAGLVDTLATFNRHAAAGEDLEFGRGSTPYERAQGDPTHRPNPCVAPISRGPYYAVETVPGSLGTFAGLRTDAHARVLDARHDPIPGLYAVGNDMASVMGGRYPAGGITLGPAMTFGYVAAHHAGGVPLAKNRP